MDITRRGFLKLVSAVTASAVIPATAFVLADPEQIIEEMPFEIGSIRAISIYEIGWDRHIVRLDAFNRKTNEQFGVDFVFKAANRECYLSARKAAERVLTDSVKQSKWLASDMIALPIPSGYREPAWMRAA